MSVSGISGTAPSMMQSQISKPRLDLQSLQTDLTSGDLAGAQKDFASFRQDLSGLLSAPPPASAGLQQASTDFQSLQSDLNSGDITAAQKDLASIMNELQGAGGQHKHHHHHHSQQNAADASSSGTAGTAGASPTAIAANGNAPNGFDVRAIMAAYSAFMTTQDSGTSVNATV